MAGFRGDWKASVFLPLRYGVADVGERLPVRARTEAAITGMRVATSTTDDATIFAVMRMIYPTTNQEVAPLTGANGPGGSPRYRAAISARYRIGQKGLFTVRCPPRTICPEGGRRMRVWHRPRWLFFRVDSSAEANDFGESAVMGNDPRGALSESPPPHPPTSAQTAAGSEGSALVSTSAPVSVTSTSSSMRIPRTPVNRSSQSGASDAAKRGWRSREGLQ